MSDTVDHTINSTYLDFDLPDNIYSFRLNNVHYIIYIHRHFTIKVVSININKKIFLNTVFSIFSHRLFNRKVRTYVKDVCMSFH